VQLIDGMRRLGFRKWYERELLQSHAHLTLTFFCAIGLFAAFEALVQFSSWTDRVIDALVAWGDVDAIASRMRGQLDAGADHVCLMVRTDSPSNPGLAAYRELAAALSEAGAGR